MFAIICTTITGYSEIIREKDVNIAVLIYRHLMKDSLMAFVTFHKEY